MGIVPGILSYNWQLKLAAFSIALLLWGLVRVDSANRQSIPARVVVENVDPEWALVGEPLPGTVEVLFGGPTGEILRVAVEGTSVHVPVDAVSTADTSIGLRSEWVAVDGLQGLVVQDIRPSSVRLYFEPMETVDRPLAYRTRGDLEASLALVQPLNLVPNTVRIRGPASRVAGIDTIFVEELDLAGVVESGTVPLAVNRATLADLLISPDSATIRIQVEESAERFVTLAIASEADASIELSSDSVRIRLFGARSRVQGLDATLLRAVVRDEDLADLQPGEERSAPLRFEGLPQLILAEPVSDSVVVRRATDP